MMKISRRYSDQQLGRCRIQWHFTEYGCCEPL